MTQHIPKEQWYALVQAWQSSGETQSQFARRYGISAKQLWAWISRARQAGLIAPPQLMPIQTSPNGEHMPTALRRTPSAPTHNPIIPIRISSDDTRPTPNIPNTPNIPSTPYTLHVRGLSLSCPELPSPHWLAQLIQALP